MRLSLARRALAVCQMAVVFFGFVRRPVQERKALRVDSKSKIQRAQPIACRAEHAGDYSARRVLGRRFASGTHDKSDRGGLRRNTDERVRGPDLDRLLGFSAALSEGTAMDFICERR